MGSLLLCRCLPILGRGVAWGGDEAWDGPSAASRVLCCCGDSVHYRPWSAWPGQ